MEPNYDGIAIEFKDALGTIGAIDQVDKASIGDEFIGLHDPSNFDWVVNPEEVPLKVVKDNGMEYIEEDVYYYRVRGSFNAQPQKRFSRDTGSL